MPALSLPRRFYSQPHRLAEPNSEWASRSHGLWLGSQSSSLWTPDAGISTLVDTGTSIGVVQEGVGAVGLYNSNQQIVLPGRFRFTNEPVSMVFVSRAPTISSSNFLMLFSVRDNSADVLTARLALDGGSNFGGRFSVVVNGMERIGTAGSARQNEYVVHGATIRSTGIDLYVNGVLDSSHSGALANSTTIDPALLNRSTGTRGFYGTLLFAGFFQPLEAEDHRAIAANPWQLFRADPVRAYFDVPAVGGDSESLTGSQVTTSSGTLSPSISVAISGAEVTASSGTIVAATSDAITGDEVTAESGDAATSVSIDISGSSVTTYSGALVSDISVALSGAEVTASAGTVSTAGDDLAALTGSEVTSSAGTVTASTSISIDGEQVTTATGTLIPAGSTAIIGDEVIVAGGDVTGNVTVALSGAEVAAYAGSVSPSGTDSAGLVGSEVTASAGALVSSISIALNGADVSAVAGAIGIAMAISGEQVNVDSGSLAAAIESAIGGDIVAANSGALTANTEVSITGSEVEAYSGTVSTSMEDAELLTGSEVTCSAGNMVGHVTIALTGSQVTVYAGSLQKPRGAIRGVVVTQKIEHAVVLGAVTGTTVTQLSRGTHVTS